MRHRNKNVKLKGTKAHEKALFRNLLTSLIIHGSIITTNVKARELKRRAEKIMTIAKKDSLHARRIAVKHIFGKEALKILFEDLNKRFSNRNSGFVRVVKIGQRQGDGAELSLIEFIPESIKETETESASKKKSQTA